MKKIKSNQILIGVGVLLLALTPAFGAHEGMTHDGTKYRALETSLDMFGTASVGQRYLNNTSGFKVNRDLELGAGLGLNHFFTRNFGLGIEASSEDTQHRFVDKALLSLIVRFPLGESGVAPYVFGGGGQQYDPSRLWFGHVGLGLEYRFTPKWGLFTDARYLITDGARDQGLGRLGVRLVF